MDGEGFIIVFVQLGSSSLEGFMNWDVDIEVFYVQCDESVAVFECNFSQVIGQFGGVFECV